VSFLLWWFKISLTQAKVWPRFSLIARMAPLGLHSKFSIPQWHTIVKTRICFVLPNYYNLKWCYLSTKGIQIPCFQEFRRLIPKIMTTYLLTVTFQQDRTVIFLLSTLTIVGLKASPRIWINWTSTRIGQKSKVLKIVTKRCHISKIKDSRIFKKNKGILLLRSKPKRNDRAREGSRLKLIRLSVVHRNLYWFLKLHKLKEKIKKSNWLIKLIILKKILLGKNISILFKKIINVWIYSLKE
jgi:hypothetical protein